jgi:hypothetical protein
MKLVFYKNNDTGGYMNKKQALVGITVILVMTLFTACNDGTETDGDIVAPSNLQLLGATSDSVTIGWTAVAGAVSYKVYRCATPGGQYVCVNGAGTSDSRYTDSGLSSSATFYYTVSAVGSEGLESSQSDYIQTSTQARLSAPAAPWVTNTTKDSITITWTPVSGAAKYEIWWCLTSEGQYINHAETMAPPYTHDGLRPATTYYYKVKALGSNGVTSEFSTYVKGTTNNQDGSSPALIMDAAPTVTTGNTQLTVSWTAVDGATAYEVWIGTTNNSALATKYGADTSGLSTTITGLSNGTTYYVWVKAKNSVGTSGFSPVASGIPRALMGTITITLAPQNDVNLPSQSVSILRGASRTFQVPGNYTRYQWYLNGTAISGAVSGSYVLNTGLMDLGVYELSVIVGTDAGARLSGNCNVSIN